MGVPMTDDDEGPLSCDECDSVMAFEVRKKGYDICADLCATHIGPWMEANSDSDWVYEFDVATTDGSC